MTLDDEHHSTTQRLRTPPGALPGTIVVDPDSPMPTITVFGYGPAGYAEERVEGPQDIPKLVNAWPMVWINVDGLGDRDVLQQLGTMFELHRLALEDVVSVHQRPKVEQYGDQLFFVARMVYRSEDIITEQVSMFLGEDYLLTFQEQEAGDCFEPVRDRIRKGYGRVRNNGSDFLAYCLIDALVDAYFPIIETYGDHLEELEDEVLESPTPQMVGEIHRARRDLLVLRRAIWPLREAINAVLRDRESNFTQESRVYLRDCYDHTIQILDLVEAYRELVSDLMDVYLSSLSAKLNEVMRVLTVIATIFIPLTFVTSLYGMNFDTHSSPWNMPELNWFFGYPLVLLIMAVIAGGQLYFFWRRGWLGTTLAPRERSREKKTE
jgi:magnesium transporter